MRELTATQAAALLNSETDIVFVDVRTADEYKSGHPRGAINIPVAEHDAYGQMQPNLDFAESVKALAPDPNTTLLFSCRAGPRSQYACELMESQGYEDTINLIGGFLGGRDQMGQMVPGWKSSGLPVE